MKQIVLFVFASLFCFTNKAQNGLAINTDGVNDYIDPNVLVNTVSNNFTYEFWARPTATHEIDVESNSITNIQGISGQRYVIWPTWRGSNAGVGVSVGTNGVSVYEHGANYLTSILTWTGTLTNWTHIAVVVNNKLSSLYINSVLVKTGLVTNMPNLFPSLGECNQYGSLVGGIGGGTYGYYKGDIDELRVWPGVRSQTQVLSTMMTELPCNTPLLAYYKFNQGIAGTANPFIQSAIDNSGNNYTATLQNFALTSTVSNWIAPGAINTLTNSTLAVSQNTVVCLGSAVTLSVSGAQTYTWNNGLTQNFIVMQPTVTTSYTVIGTSANNCTSSAVTTVSVPALISAAAVNSLVCAGSAATLSANGGNTYTWLPAGGNNSLTTVLPGSSTTYSVFSQMFPGCTYSASVPISVVPALSVTPASTLLCTPQSITLVAVGGNGNYYWPQTGGTTSLTTVLPFSSTTYTVKSTVPGSCTLSAVATVSFVSSVSLSPVTASVCEGQSILLTAAGSGTPYTWSSAGTASNATQILVQPIANTVYTVTSQIGNCSSSATAAITVINGITVSPTLSAICAGNAINLQLNGATIYTINPGSTVTNIATVNPAVTTTYVVSALKNASCFYTVAAVVVVEKCLGIENLNLQTATKLFPNPFNNEIIYTSSTPAEISVYDITGKLVVLGKLDLEKPFINTSTISKGLYLVVLTTAEGQYTFKMLKE